jgi:phage shock protein PspC (stress-responsive transcriptional regulator)
MSENAPGATRCAACTSWMERPQAREWTRPEEGSWIAGVCQGLANRFALPVAPIRLVFLLAAICGGWGLLVYIACWVVMPREPRALPPAAVEARVPPPAETG